MEQVKYLPPKFSHSMKDLTNFLGIFELSEDELKRERDATSETSSNLSHVTSNQFRPHRHELEVVHEKNDGNSDSQEESSESDEVPGTAVG